MNTGLVLNDDITWVCYHGVFDFAYFLRNLLNIDLPETENEFIVDIKTYFPVLYDLK